MSLRGVPTMSGRRSNLYFGNGPFRGNDISKSRDVYLTVQTSIISNNTVYFIIPTLNYQYHILYSVLLYFLFIRAMAVAAMASPAPLSPSPSFVFALTLTALKSMPSKLAMQRFI